MKTTFGRIIGAQEALRALLREKLPVGEAVALARLCKALDGELQLFSERRAALMTQYGIGTDDADAQGFEDDLRALLAVEVTIDAEKTALTVREASGAWVLDAEDFVEFKEESE